MRNYRGIARERLVVRSKSEAVGNFRRELAAMFQAMGLEPINGVTAAEYVRTAKISV